MDRGPAAPVRGANVRRFGALSETERAACLAEWRQAEQGRIGLDDAALEDLERRTASHAHREESAELNAAAGRAEKLVADALAAEHPRLAHLLRDQAGDPPLLAAAFAYFFRREVESNEDLSGELMCDSLRRLSAPLAGALGGLGQALARLGSRFDALVDPPLEPCATAAPAAAPLADRPSPFVALRRGRQGTKGERRGAGASTPGAARPSAYLVSPSGASPLAPRLSAASRPGPAFVNALGMQFGWVPPGEFLMGSPPEEAQRDADEKPRRVRIARGCFLGAHPVTRGQFGAFVREAKYITEAERKEGVHRGPSGEWRLDPWCNWKRPDFPQDDDHPVVCVSWNDARAFCDWLAGRERQKEGAYRLPTEAEWEHACRAGTTTPFWPGAALSTDQANYNGQAEGDGLFREGTTPVWVFPPNAWGLFNVHGNVWEWCADWYGPYPDGDAVDPRGPATGRQRVLRGGSWRNPMRDSSVRRPATRWPPPAATATRASGSALSSKRAGSVGRLPFGSSFRLPTTISPGETIPIRQVAIRVPDLRRLRKALDQPRARARG